MRRITPEEIDAHAMKLHEEFQAHYDEFVALHPEKNDKQIVFDAWAIQKLASLQLIVLALTEETSNLRAELELWQE